MALPTSWYPGIVSVCVIHTLPPGAGPLGIQIMESCAARLIVKLVEPMLVVALFDPLIDVLADWVMGCAHAEESRQLIKIKMTPMFVARTSGF